VTNFIQVGNPAVSPTVPFLLQRNNATQLPSGFEGAAGGYAVEIENEDTLDASVASTVRRSVSREGSASVLLLDDTIAASAASSYSSSRDYAITNTTDELISFNFVGQFDAMLRAEYTGDDGVARVAGSFELGFEGIDRENINYFPVAPYLTVVQEENPESSVAQSFLAFSDDSTQMTFNASASATGTGPTTLARLEADHRYAIGLTLNPFAEVLLTTGFTQANSVDHTPLASVAPVPLPASAWLLLCGLSAVFGLRRKSATL